MADQTQIYIEAMQILGDEYSKHESDQFSRTKNKSSGFKPSSKFGPRSKVSASTNI